MAGPSVVVRVLSDLKGFTNGLKDAGNAGKAASGQIHSAFSGLLGTLNQTGVLGPFGESLSAIDEQFSNLTEHGHQLGQVMLGLGGTFVGVGTGLALLGSKDRAARQQLEAAIDATGKSWDDYSKRVDEAIKHNERFGDTAATTEQALQTLTQATNDPAKALDLMGLALDLAAAKHESLVDAATQVAKVLNGNTKLLKQFGITTQNAAAATKAADTASKQAVAADKTLAETKRRLADIEQIDATRKKLTTAQAITLRDAQQKVTDATAAAAAAHQKATGAQQAATDATKNQASGLDQLQQKLKGQASASVDTFAGRMNALRVKVEDAAAAFGDKYGNAIQTAGVLMSGFGAILETGRGLLEKYRASLAATEAAEITTEAAGLPLLATLGLVVAAVAAVGLAAYEVYRNWGRIWPLLKQGWQDVADYITASWNNLVSDFEAIPGQIAAIADHMWDSVYDNFKKTMDQIANYHLNVGGGSINFGDIIKGPFWDLIHGRVPFMAQGGLVTKDGLIYAHAGEAVTPAAQLQRHGPAVVINDAHFASDIDVEAFMRRVAWTMQTQGV